MAVVAVAGVVVVVDAEGCLSGRSNNEHRIPEHFVSHDRLSPTPIPSP